MRIAVDYDKTFTTHKGFWLRFMVQCQDMGWDVIIVTHRHAELDWDEDFEQLWEYHQIQTYFTDGKAKKPFLKDLGVEVNIWVDDKPEGIVADSPWAVDSLELAAWRAAGRP
jgi:hypothetical protein